MNVNYIVSFKRHPQVMFDIEIDTDKASFNNLKGAIELCAFVCLWQNDFDTRDVLKISTTAVWANDWRKDSGTKPSDIEGSFGGEIYYKDDCTLHDIFSNIFPLEKLCKTPKIYEAYSKEDYFKNCG